MIKEKVFLIRLDKIGDLVATLPVDQAPWLNNATIKWIVEDGVTFLPKLTEPERSFSSLSLKYPWSSYRKLLNILRSEKPTRTLNFYGPWWVNLACWWAKVPLRGGRLSQWHSYLFLNRGLRQSRSKSEFHESFYNWRLLQYLFAQKPLTPANENIPLLKIKAPLQRQLLEQFQLGPKDYIVVHPGMAGSALNWPQARYNELIERLTEFSTVVITGTKADQIWLSEIAPRWRQHPRIRWLQDKLSFNELIYLLQNAKHVIGPSTGVLHLAAASGTPTTGIYSPVLAHHPRRWGLRGFGTKIILPEVNCPARQKCWGPKCQHFTLPSSSCLSHIEVTAVIKDVL